MAITMHSMPVAEVLRVRGWLRGVLKVSVMSVTPT